MLQRYEAEAALNTQLQSRWRRVSHDYDASLLKLLQLQRQSASDAAAPAPDAEPAAAAAAAGQAWRAGAAALAALLPALDETAQLHLAECCGGPAAAEGSMQPDLGLSLPGSGGSLADLQLLLAFIDDGGESLDDVLHCTGLPLAAPQAAQQAAEGPWAAAARVHAELLGVAAQAGACSPAVLFSLLAAGPGAQGSSAAALPARLQLSPGQRLDVQAVCSSAAAAHAHSHAKLQQALHALCRGLAGPTNSYRTALSGAGLDAVEAAADAALASLQADATTVQATLQRLWGAEVRAGAAAVSGCVRCD